MKEREVYWEERRVKWMDWERQGRRGGFEEVERRDREREIGKRGGRK